jgi:ribonuclease R
MAKAEYSTQNIGHYGLAFDFYTHFTSPIRRYPDVMVHRMLQHYLEGGQNLSASEFEVKCKHSSEREKKAAEAERASIKYKQVEFLMTRLGETFKGVISGVTGWGLYVELVDNKCEGMVSLDNLTDDQYYYDEARLCLKGRATGREYHFGDEVVVVVAGANLLKRQLDFEMASNYSF